MPPPLPTNPSDPALLVSDLEFSHRGPAAWSLSIRHLQLPRQAQLLLTGGSGRGKSTLLQIIAGLLDPAAGSVLVAGQNVHALHGPRRDLFRGRNIGMIFQTFHLLHGFTALENVLAGMMFTPLAARERLARASYLLSHLGIDRPGALPEELSVGQQQRVAVARAVAAKPVLVLADEPTSSLDPEAADTAIRLIQETCRESGAALLCTSHDPAMAARFENRVALDALVATTAPAPEPAR